MESLGKLDTNITYIPTKLYTGRIIYSKMGHHLNVKIETILFNTLYEKSNQICNTYSLIFIHFTNVQYYHFMISDFQFLVRETVVVWLPLVATVMPAVRLQETVVLILKRNVGLAVRVAVEVWHPLVAVTVMQAVMMQEIVVRISIEYVQLPVRVWWLSL